MNVSEKMIEELRSRLADLKKTAEVDAAHREEYKRKPVSFENHAMWVMYMTRESCEKNEVGFLESIISRYCACGAGKEIRK